MAYTIYSAINDGEQLTARRHNQLYASLIQNGVAMGVYEEMQVTPASGLAVQVGRGMMWIGRDVLDPVRRWVLGDGLSPSDTLVLPVAANTGSSNRIDRVVVKLDQNATPKVSIYVKQGTTSPPTLQRSGSVYEMSLAQVRVVPNATSITSADITDERGDPSVCGWAFDRTELFPQNAPSNKPFVPVMNSNRDLYSRWVPLAYFREPTNLATDTAATTSTTFVQITRRFMLKAGPTQTSARIYVNWLLQCGSASAKRSVRLSIDGNVFRGWYQLSGQTSLTVEDEFDIPTTPNAVHVLLVEVRADDGVQVTIQAPQLMQRI